MLLLSLPSPTSRGLGRNQSLCSLALGLSGARRSGASWREQS